jgi:hypothetical protein
MPWKRASSALAKELGPPAQPAPAQAGAATSGEWDMKTRYSGANIVCAIWRTPPFNCTGSLFKFM